MKLLIAVNTITSISLATADNFFISSGTVYGSSCDPKIESKSCICEMITDIPNSDMSLSPAAPFYSCAKGKCLKENDGTGAEGCLKIPKSNFTRNFTCNDCAALEGDDPSETKISTPSETKTSTSSAPKTGSVLPLTDSSSASIYTYPVISVLAMLIISPLYF